MELTASQVTKLYQDANIDRGSFEASLNSLGIAIKDEMPSSYRVYCERCDSKYEVVHVPSLVKIRYCVNCGSRHGLVV